MQPMSFPFELPPLLQMEEAAPRNVVDCAEALAPERPPFVFTKDHVQPGSTMDVVIATHELCRTLGKVAKQKRRDSIRVEMVCGMKVRDGDPPCPFFVRAAMVTTSLLKITNINTNHSCTTVPARQRQVKSSILAASSSCVEFFVPSKGRLGGNAYQLQTQMRVQHGITMKPVRAPCYNVFSRCHNVLGLVTMPYHIVTMLRLFGAVANYSCPQHLLQIAIFIPGALPQCRFALPQCFLLCHREVHLPSLLLLCM